MRPCDIKPMWVEVPMLVSLARWAKGLVPYSMRKSPQPTPGAISDKPVKADLSLGTEAKWPPHLK
jgi:hypothetical protein